MSTSSPELTISVDAPPAVSTGRTLWTTLLFFWKYALGVVFCQSLLGSLLIVGWTYRLMQRCTLKQWWKASPLQTLYPSFADWARQTSAASEHPCWPNWLVKPNLSQEFKQAGELSGLNRWSALFALPFFSLWANFKTGLLGAFNTAVLILPAALLWLFSWYDGWNNSFHKGYEQATVGPLLGVSGILLFVAAMLYVPWAQARQAATGEWKAFYHFPMVWKLVRRHWLAGALLAALYSFCSLPLQILKTGLMFAPLGNPAIEQFTDPEALAYLNLYFLRAGIIVFPLYILTKIVASRVYARALLQDLERGHIAVHQLGALERRHLETLNLIQVNPARARHVLTRVAVGTTSGLIRIAGLTIASLLWFTFAAQIYIAEFLKYNPILGWLNQPLVLLPWFRYIPARLENQGAELAFLSLILGVVGVSLWLHRKLRPSPKTDPRQTRSN